VHTGWVYVFTNPSFPNLVKVGWTSGDPKSRADEIYTTGVPSKFHLETAFLFAHNAYRVEQEAHSLLENNRENDKREFFRCSPSFAATIILEAAALIGEPVRHTEPELPPITNVPYTNIPITNLELLAARFKALDKQRSAQIKEAKGIEEAERLALFWAIDKPRGERIPWSSAQIEEAKMFEKKQAEKENSQEQVDKQRSAQIEDAERLAARFTAIERIPCTSAQIELGARFKALDKQRSAQIEEAKMFEKKQAKKKK